MTISDAFRRVFMEEGGYDDVEIGFVPYIDLKASWRRSYKWIRIDLSDYLMEMPDHVAEAMAGVILDRIGGGSMEYPDCFIEWTESACFLKNRPTFLRRCGYREAEPGSDLDMALRWLSDHGLEMPEGVDVGWHPGERTVRSRIFRVIAIGDAWEGCDVEEVARKIWDAAALFSCRFGEARA